MLINGCGTTFIMSGTNCSYKTNSCCCCTDANKQLLIDDDDSTSWSKTHYCTLVRSVGFIPVVFVLALLLLTYYPIMILTLLPLFHERKYRCCVVSKFTMFADAAGIAVIILYHVLLVLSLSSYITTILSHPGQPPASFAKRADAGDFAT